MESKVKLQPAVEEGKGVEGRVGREGEQVNDERWSTWFEEDQERGSRYSG